MKKILLLMLGTCTLFAANAQVKIDRSKKPAAGPAPVITVKEPAMFVMPNGITVLVVEDHKLPKVSASLIIDQGPIKEGDKAGMISLLSGMMEEGTTNMSKADYDKQIDQIGANVNVSANGASASALTRYFDKAFSLMANGLQNPAFPAESLEKLRSQTLTGLKNADKSAEAVASRTWSALNYGKNTAFGEFETVETIKNISLDDIKNAYKQYVSPSRSYLTFIGDITVPQAKAMAEKYLGNWKGPKLTLAQIPDMPNPKTSEIDFINMPTAVQAQLNVGNLISNPMNGKDYFPLLLANQILGGGADSKLFMNLREKHGFTYGSYSSIGSGRYQSLFNASAQVRTDKADSAVAEIIKEILAMRDGNITPEQLATAKAKYNGNFALQMEDPARTARFATNILINNLPKDFYSTYLQKINAVTIDDIKRVSKAYLSEGNSRIAIVGNADKIMPQLLRLGYPIKKYDVYANPVVDEMPVKNTATTPATTDKVSAYSIVEDYLKAIGGKEELKKVNSLQFDFSMELMGRTMTGVAKQMNPSLNVQEIKMGTMTVFRRGFDGTNGFTMQGGQSKDMGMEEINLEKDKKGIFPQLNYFSGNDFKTEYIGAGKVNDEPTYRLRVVSPSGKTTVEHYSIKTGLLLQEESSFTLEGEPVEAVVTYADYRKVGNIMLPFSQTQSQGGQEFTLVGTTYKINEGVTAADFGK